MEINHMTSLKIENIIVIVICQILAHCEYHSVNISTNTFSK